MSQLLIQGGQCVNPTGIFTADVLVDEGRIVALGRNLPASADRVIQAGGLLVLPGGVDVHVHMPWPAGATISSDDLASGTKAAAFGGVTTVLDFVIPDSGETPAAALGRKLEQAQASAWVDYSFHINIRDHIDDAIAGIRDLIDRGFPSFKVFMAYDGFRIPDGDLLRIMRAVADGGMLSVHAEDGALADLATQELVAAGRSSLANYPSARPRLCEISAIQRVIAYARHLGTRVHIHHVSTAEGAALIGAARKSGLSVTGETCPQYLTLDERVYAEEPVRAAAYVCAPPIRSAADQDALWKALASDSLSAIATDHCPFTRQQKQAHRHDLTQVPGGMAGVETRLPLVYSAGVRPGRLSLSRFVETMATGPARIFGLYPRKGIIAVGADADLVLFDPDRSTQLRASDLHMNTDCLPFEGWEVQGWPVTTILRGEPVVENGTLVKSEPAGKLVPRRLERTNNEL